MGLRPGEGPFSASKLRRVKKGEWLHHNCCVIFTEQDHDKAKHRRVCDRRDPKNPRSCWVRPETVTLPTVGFIFFWGGTYFCDETDQQLLPCGPKLFAYVCLIAAMWGTDLHIHNCQRETMGKASTFPRVNWGS